MISTHLQITFDMVLYSLAVYTQGVSRALFSMGIIDIWGAYTADVRETNLHSCICLVTVMPEDTRIMIHERIL